MMKVGLTGGIGSGKSTVAQLLEVYKIPVYHADEKAKIIMNNNHDVKDSIIALLGREAYSDTGLNRPYVAKKVFNDRILLESLNQIVHPAVGRDWLNWCEEHQNAKLVVQEAAILFENGSYRKFDLNILVMAPLELRIKRVMGRDQVSREQVMERINNQWDDEEKRALADWLIVNDDRRSLIVQISELIEKYSYGNLG